MVAATVVIAGVLPLLDLLNLVPDFILMNVYQASAMVFHFYMLACGIYVYLQGQKRARFYVLAWVMGISGVAVFAATLNGLLPYNAFTSNSMYYAFGLQTMLFGLALGDRYNLLRQQKEAYQQEILTNSEEQKELLEARVIERTAELSDANEELQTSEEELRQNMEELTVLNERMQDTLHSLSLQNELTEQKNRDITKSINYAERIQSSFLPQPQELANALGDYCLFYKPRDIVSGDFYWLHQPDPTTYYLAIADCTGHGVPGAFMSFLGNSLLNQIVVQNGVTEPNQILNQLHVGVQEALKQKDTNNRDGMDISVIKVNKLTKRVQFAGAKTTMVMISGENMKEVKGDRVPIGGRQLEQHRQFKQYNTLIKAPTNIYLFTDGFVDQFGGADDRKLMIKRFRQILLHIQVDTLQQQAKHLEASFNNWKRHTSQIDDVLVMGVNLG